MSSALLTHDLAILGDSGWLIGLDEAGRGPLAGPVVAAAVAMPRASFFLSTIQGLAGSANDSKLLREDERVAIYCEMERLAQQGYLNAAIHAASEHEIEQLNILGATTLAMRRCVYEILLKRKLTVMPTDSNTVNDVQRHLPLDDSPLGCTTTNAAVLVDGLPVKNLGCGHTAIVMGDGRSLCIALASILAKVSRDRHMAALDFRFPMYGFLRNKGYASAEHRQAILQHGPCAVHRRKFLEKIMGKPAQEIILPGSKEQLQFSHNFAY